MAEGYYEARSRIFGSGFCFDFGFAGPAHPVAYGVGTVRQESNALELSDVSIFFKRKTVLS